jgi:tetratricopeptide (TPR) repeat protein
VISPLSARIYPLALIAFVLAMLAKPSAMVAPALALVIDLWLLRRPMRSIAVALSPWFVLSVLCAIVARLAQITDFDPAPLWARPLIAGDALAFYLYKLIWPTSLGIDYGRRPDVVMAHWWFYAAWIIPSAVGVFLWLNRRRAPELLAAGAIFLLALSPVLGLVPFQFQYLSTVTDHYAYVAMLGPALAAGWLVQRAMRRFAPLPVLSASAVVLAALGVRSLLQTGVWRDDLSLFSNAVAVNPRSTVCLTSLGRTYLTRGELEEAERRFVQALKVDPDFWFARENLALLFELQGNFAAAVEEHKLSLSTIDRRPGSLERDQMGITAAALARDLAILGRHSEASVYLDLAREYGAEDAIVQSVADEINRRSTGASTRPLGLP